MHTFADDYATAEPMSRGARGRRRVTRTERLGRDARRRDRARTLALRAERARKYAAGVAL